MLAVLFQLERSQTLPREALWAQQARQLRSLVGHAISQSPFHARLSPFLKHLQGEFDAGEFARLPLLTRADLQASFESLCARSVPPSHGETRIGGTSGSTGQPVRYLDTSVSAFFWQAFALREHLWHERDFSAKMLVLRVTERPAVHPNWLGATGPGPEVMKTGPCVVLPAVWSFDRQLDSILEERPQYLLGYANNLWEVFRAAERRGAVLPWLHEVRSFGETVQPEMRAYFRDRWKLPVSDIYTTSECGYLAIQCPENGSYHVQSESAVVEIIDDEGHHCRPGETGRVVVTPLHNFAYPLIRYELGDYAEVGEPCACGRTLPVLARIHGRARNSVRMPDGSRHWPSIAMDKMAKLAPIRQCRIVQTSLQVIEVRLVVERPLTEGELAALREHLSARFGHRFEWKFVFSQALPPQPGYKFEDFISEVP
jgi:phenylacetate-CoA ligase